MDLSRLRDAALRDGEDEEAVTVDTRALIDKVLARYSGEWTTLRELIQNAADARATTVVVKWETFPSTQVPLPSNSSKSELLKHVLAHHTLRRLLVQNDGQPFTKTDWGRLKRIAEGNPDETKIGAFGVGFYSVFADCEEPFVQSGNEAMAFYWKGNALFTKKINNLADGQASSDTTFMLDYRNKTTPLPNLLSVSQFLATSLTFVALEKMEFWIDDYKILSLHKKASPAVDVDIPRNLDTKTREGLMTITSADRTSTQIDASFMAAIGWKPQAATSSSKTHDVGGGSDISSLKSFFHRLTIGSAAQAAARAKAAEEEKAARDALTQDITTLSRSSIFLRATSASIKTFVSASFAAELERATKKPPPRTTKLAILTSSYDETKATESSNDFSSKKAADVFASVLPSKKPGGRIFIGFPTGQTTGAGLHISAPSVIPTVEREAIDLNARWVRTWNMEMLRCAGIMTRLAYINEMAELSTKMSYDSKGNLTASDLEKFIPEALHVLKTFTFVDSTPSSHVGGLIEEAFWTSYKKATIEIMSTRGVLSTAKVRMANEELNKFVDGIPVIPEQLKDNEFVAKLHDLGLIGHISVNDIRQELDGKALTKDQLIHFVRWAGKKCQARELDPSSRDSLLQVAVATISDDGSSGEIVALASIRNFLSINKIPPTMPIPPTTIPFEFTNKCPTAELTALGWQTLEVIDWVSYLIKGSLPDSQTLTKNASFAVSVLTVISKNWDNLSNSHKEAVIDLLRNVTAVPTKMGMKKPGEAYFQTVKLFDDLPTLEGCSNVKEKFLTALGVRKTVELETIFSRLLNSSSGGGSWSHVELIKYLASVQRDIPAEDMKKLKESRICAAEAGPKGAEATKATTQLFKVSELFEPKDTLRALGLRCLQWPGPPGSYRANSTEGKFLAGLGLRPYPSVKELVDMMCSIEPSKRDAAMTYFIANHHTNGYAAYDVSNFDKAILPIEGSEKRLVRPYECYTNAHASILGYNILKKELHAHAAKFGVARDPPIANCVKQLLSRPPESVSKATQLFEYFATRLGELGESSLEKLRDAPIVPVLRQNRHYTSEKSGTITYIAPRQSYLGKSSMYDEVFDFVDFGQTANAFLFKCGAKTEPTKLEIAEMACNEPARLLSTLQSPEKYLNLLRTLADDLATLKRDKDLFRKMKSSPFLLAFREESKRNQLIETEEDDQPVRRYQLASARQIVVPDDYISYRLFKDSLICAPEEDSLESFYLALGAQSLSTLVEEDLRPGPHYDKQESAIRKRNHILERTRLFLHEYNKYSRDAVKHDAKWLEKSLTVEVVRSLQLRRTLKGERQSHVEKRYAAAQRNGSGWVLYILHGAQEDMYQVGQAVCQMILNRPSQQAYFFFEPFLKLELLQLRDRGYNVDRILRAKQAEARIAEEERRKALAAEQERRLKQLEEQAPPPIEAVGRHARAQTPEQAPAPGPSMPGSFGPDSPEAYDPPPQPSKKGKSGFLNTLKGRFGFETNSDDDEDLDPHLALEQGHDAKPKPDDGRVTDPSIVKSNLQNAIKATRAHESGTHFNKPKTTEVKETATYCDTNHAHDLRHLGFARNGMRVYAAPDLKVDREQWFEGHTGPINAFATLLTEIAGVYGLAPSSMHVFYDETGPTIAFNSNGSIFCNLRFFLQLHAPRIRGSKLEQGEAKADAAIYWWVVVAHELAHNLVKQHDSNHSYYTESFCQTYWREILAVVGRWYGSSASGPGGGALPPPPPQESGTSGWRNVGPPAVDPITQQQRQQVHGRYGHRSSVLSSITGATTRTPRGAPPPYRENNHF